MFRESFTHLICPRHPRCGRQSRYWEVHQRQVANLLHRNLTSAGYSAGCAFRLQKYHYPSPRSSPSTECSSVSPEVSLNRSLRFQGRSWRAFRTWLNRSSQFGAGNVLMKWYSIWICYEVKLASSPIRTKTRQIIGYPEKIFLFFSKRLLYSHKLTNIRHSPVLQFLQVSYRQNIGKLFCDVAFPSKSPPHG